jgi:hypothetical protein
LDEVRNLNSIAEATDAAMDVIAHTFEHATSYPILSIEVFDSWMDLGSAAAVIGTNWPNRARLARLLRELNPQDSSSNYTMIFGVFVSSIGTGLEEVHAELSAFARSEDKNLRSLWPDALARGWKDEPSTLALLKRQLLDDPIPSCRRTAISAYLRYCAKNNRDESLTLMREVLQRDESGMVRLEAINHLWVYGAPSFKPLFKAYLSDDYPLVRATAFHAIKENPNESTFTLIQDRLDKESMNWLRQDLYGELARVYSNNPQTFESLLKGAKNDEDPVIRSYILNLLATHFSDDRRTWDFLVIRERDDSDLSVRSTAESLITTHNAASVPPV